MMLEVVKMTFYIIMPYLGPVCTILHKKIKRENCIFEIIKLISFLQNSIKQHLSTFNVLQSYYFGITRLGITREQIENGLYM